MVSTVCHVNQNSYVGLDATSPTPTGKGQGPTCKIEIYLFVCAFYLDAIIRTISY